MKIAILSDIHFGIRLDSQILLHHFFKFFHQIFLPILKQENIDTIFIAGDLFDRRKYININTAFEINRNFWAPLSNKKVHVLAGNHDVYHTNTLKVSSLQAIIPNSLDIKYHIYLEPKEINFEGIPVLVLPWICQDNEEISLKAVQETKAQICFAHLHLKGFQLMNGIYSQEGMDAELFNKFDMVLTGHFHHIQTKGNIHYLGAPYQMTWDDWDSLRGFHIFDFDTRQLSFIQNPYEIFHKVVYDDLNNENVLNLDWDKFSDAYVKVLIKNKTNPFYFDKFIEKMEQYAFDVKIVENKKFDIETKSPLGDLNTLSVLKVTLEEAELNFDKKKLENFLVDLYHQARKMEA